MTHRNITHRLVQQTNCQIRYALLTWIFIIKGIFVGGFDLGPLLALIAVLPPLGNSLLTHRTGNNTCFPYLIAQTHPNVDREGLSTSQKLDLRLGPSVKTLFKREFTIWAYAVCTDAHEVSQSHKVNKISGRICVCLDTPWFKNKELMQSLHILLRHHDEAANNIS